MDCDMLCLGDINDLFVEALSSQASIAVCQHDYVPKHGVKFLGQQQTTYERKNWSSVMWFNNRKCTTLTPGYVNEAGGLELHRFRWLHKKEIAALPLEYNWLVAEYEKNADAKILHYTNGGPWFFDFRECDYSREWFAEQRHMNDCGPPHKYLKEPQ
jgi:hypothetical protein